MKPEINVIRLYYKTNTLLTVYLQCYSILVRKLSSNVKRIKKLFN